MADADKTCEFYVEDAHELRRYVVKLRPQDMGRVKCRTIHRHLAQSAGFPYASESFELWGGQFVAHRLRDDETGAEIGLRPGTVLKLFLCQPEERRSTARSSGGAEAGSHQHSLPQDSYGGSSGMILDGGDQEFTLGELQGLTRRQVDLQNQLLAEFRRSSSRSPSSPHHDAGYAADRGRGDSPVLVESKTTRVTLQRPSTEGIAASPVRQRIREHVPRSAPVSVAALMARRPTEDPDRSPSPSFDRPRSDSNSGPRPASVRTQQRYEEEPASGSLECLVTEISEKDSGAGGTGETRPDRASASSASTAPAVAHHDLTITALLQEDVEKLLVEVASFATAQQVAQEEIRALRSALADSQEKWRAASAKAEALEGQAVHELKAHLGIKFVKSQADFETIVRHFSRHREDEARIARLEKSNAELKNLLASEQRKRRALQTHVEDMKGHVRVIVRVRPPIVESGTDEGITGTSSLSASYHPTDAQAIIDSERGVVSLVSSTSGTRRFEFFRVLDSGATQREVYQEVAPLVPCCVDGTNVCVIAYGQTGSGKTHSILGPTGPGDTDQAGIVPRTLKELFAAIAERTDLWSCVTCSLVELYNESIVDLFHSPTTAAPHGTDARVEVRSSGAVSAVKHQIRSSAEALQLLHRGSQARQVHATRVNAQSSRSHLIFTVFVNLRSTDFSGPPPRESKMVFVDLAGSERIAQTQSTGDRLKEAQFINKSLASLGDVVAALSVSESRHVDPVHVPYRNSKLTMLLQDCVGGKSRTVLLACVAPFRQRGATGQRVEAANIPETLSTLQFAARVRLVRNDMLALSATPSSRGTSPVTHAWPLENPSRKDSGSVSIAPAAVDTMLQPVSINQQRAASRADPKRAITPMRF